MMCPEPYNNVGLLGEIANSLPLRHRQRPLTRHREPKDSFEKRKRAKKMAKVSRRKNRR